jgi:hypothetical protein
MRRTGKVTARVLNVRDAPSLYGRKIGYATRGTVVEIIDDADSWRKISSPMRGFVHGNYLAETETRAPVRLTEDPSVVSLTPKTAIAGHNATGRRLARVYNQYGGLLEWLAAKSGISASAAVSVICAESSGAGFGADGRMIIRFEPHIFYRLWGREHHKEFSAWFVGTNWRGYSHRYRPSVGAPWRQFHGSQKLEWEAFTIACGLDETAAMQSISMGMFQIMGFNHEQVGYKTVQEMFERFNSDIRYQIQGFFDFLTPDMVRALQWRDFTTFARYYNGSGQAHAYGERIGGYVTAFNLLR